MWPLIEASIFTSAIYLGIKVTKGKAKPIAYVIIFFSSLVASWLFGSTLHGEILDAKIEIHQVKTYLSTLQTKLSKTLGK